jgi:hypothetical protein
MTTYYTVLAARSSKILQASSDPSCVRPAGTLCTRYLRWVLSAAEAIAGTCVGLLMNIQCRLNFGREEG